MSDIELRIELEALISEREGMIAENKQREHMMMSIAYSDAEFNENAKRIRELISKEPKQC